MTARLLALMLLFNGVEVRFGKCWGHKYGKLPEYPFFQQGRPSTTAPTSDLTTHLLIACYFYLTELTLGSESCRDIQCIIMAKWSGYRFMHDVCGKQWWVHPKSDMDMSPHLKLCPMLVLSCLGRLRADSSGMCHLLGHNQGLA